MSHKDFSISKSADQDRTAPDNLNTNITDWKLIADQFYRSSEIIFAQLQNDETVCTDENHLSQSSSGEYIPQLDPVYFFLTGMCLENLLKGILIHQNPDLVKGSQLKGKIKSHDLKLLANDIVGCQFTDTEKQLFEFLTAHTVWISKYPIPTKADDFFEWMYYLTESVREAFLSVYKKLSRVMEATCDLKAHLHNYVYVPHK